MMASSSWKLPHSGIGNRSSEPAFYSNGINGDMNVVVTTGTTSAAAPVAVLRATAAKKTRGCITSFNRLLPLVMYIARETDWRLAHGVPLF